MNIDLNNIQVIPNNWFSSSVSYIGQGKAELSNPDGFISGTMSVDYDEKGNRSAVMQIDDFRTEEDLSLGLRGLLLGQKPGSNSVGFGGGSPRICKSLEVTTKDGSLSFRKAFLSGHTFQVGGSCKNETSVSFDNLRAEYRVHNAIAPRYWVLPLTNCVTRFSCRFQELDNHPLRIFPTPQIPSELPETGRFWAEQKAHSQNRLVAFLFNGSFSFIEGLQDYQERIQRLKDGQERCLITAVMVGEVKDLPIGFEAVLKWHPQELFRILGFASGTPVGSPWLELRDKTGQLTHRYHFGSGQSSYANGFELIDESIHRGTSHLLMCRLNYQGDNKSDLDVTLHLARTANERGNTIEQQFATTFRAFDLLCKQFDVSPSWQPSDSLPNEAVKIIEEAIEEAARKIATLPLDENHPNSQRNSQNLSKVIRNVRTAKVLQTNYGSKIEALIKKFDLPDPDIFNARARKENQKFAPVISRLRGKIMHGGYLNFGEQARDAEYIQLLYHLRDILFRILLKILDYKGQYQPQIIRATASEPVDWIKPDMTASTLGYSATIETTDL